MFILSSLPIHIEVLMSTDSNCHGIDSAQRTEREAVTASQLDSSC
jgi:hypothetical protein